MDENERKEHFKGFARLLFNDIDDIFNNLSIERSDCDEVSASKSIQNIQEIIAESAYDLVAHAAKLIHYEAGHYPLEMLVKDVPDITAWPPTE